MSNILEQAGRDLAEVENILIELDLALNGWRCPVVQFDGICAEAGCAKLSTRPSGTCREHFRDRHDWYQRKAGGSIACTRCKTVRTFGGHFYAGNVDEICPVIPW